MKPFYSDGRRTIYHCPFEDGLGLLSHADCVLADPPYGETNLEWDRWPDMWPQWLLGEAKPNASLWCFGSTRMFFDHLREFDGWRLVQDLIWEKQNGSGFLTDRFRRVHESVVQFVAAGCAWADVYKSPVFTDDAVRRRIYRQTKPAHYKNAGPHIFESENGGRRLQRSVLRFKNCHGIAENETQKPTGLVDALIRYSVPDGGCLASIFMGSGTDLVVAKELGLNAIGFDVREQQCEVAANRLQAMFDFQESAV